MIINKTGKDNDIEYQGKHQVREKPNCGDMTVIVYFWGLLNSVCG